MGWHDNAGMVFCGFGGVLASLTSVASAREEVVFKDDLPKGTIVVKQKEKRLYFVTGEGKAVRYKVAVGMPGKQWNGTAAISSKHLRPAWMPPQEVKRDKPSLPDLIAGGAPNNPMVRLPSCSTVMNMPSMEPMLRIRLVVPPLMAASACIMRIFLTCISACAWEPRLS